MVVTGIRSDLLRLSRRARSMAIIELTVPRETRFDEAHQRKVEKFAVFADEIHAAGFKYDLWTIEGHSVSRCFRALGLNVRGEI